MAPPTKAEFSAVLGTVRVSRIEEHPDDPRGDTVIVVLTSDAVGEVRWPILRKDAPTVGALKSLCVAEPRPDLKAVS